MTSLRVHFTLGKGPVCGADAAGLQASFHPVEVTCEHCREYLGSVAARAKAPAPKPPARPRSTERRVARPSTPPPRSSLPRCVVCRARLGCAHYPKEGRRPVCGSCCPECWPFVRLGRYHGVEGALEAALSRPPVPGPDVRQEAS